MLDFYFHFQKNKFIYFSEKILLELNYIFEVENISILKSDKNFIPEEQSKLLTEDICNKINDLYYTIFSKGLEHHSLLKKYLPKVNQKKVNQKDILFADFFSGAGGLSLGLSNVGFKPFFINDIYLDALETYYFNHDLSIEHYCANDIRAFLEHTADYKNILKNIKLVVGGPPCQGFSTANRQPLKDDPRNTLYKDFLLVLNEIQPDFFIMENVRGMKHKIKEIESDINTITGTTYKYTELLLNAKDFGIPQNRERFFLVGNKVGINNTKLATNIYSQRNGINYLLKDALFGLPELKTNPKKSDTAFESEEHGFQCKKLIVEQNDFLRLINDNRNIDYLLNHKSRYNNSNDLEIFNTLKQGENALTESIQHLNKYTKRNDIFKDKYYRLKENDVSKTITSHMQMDCHMYIHPTQARGISPREAARLQTFPDDYFFRGALNSWYKQIGNAVPVKLGEIIAKEIIKYYL